MTALARNKVKYAYFLAMAAALQPEKRTDKIITQHQESIENAFDNYEDVIRLSERQHTLGRIEGKEKQLKSIEHLESILDEKLNALEKKFQAHIDQQAQSKR